MRYDIELACWEDNEHGIRIKRDSIVILSSTSPDSANKFFRALLNIANVLWVIVSQ